MLKDTSLISLIVVLIFFFSNNTVSLFKNLMTISTMNRKSGTNGILPQRTKRGITLDLYKSKMSYLPGLFKKATERTTISL